MAIWVGSDVAHRGALGGIEIEELVQELHANTTQVHELLNGDVPPIVRIPCDGSALLSTTTVS